MKGASQSESVDNAGRKQRQRDAQVDTDQRRGRNNVTVAEVQCRSRRPGARLITPATYST